MVHLPVYVLSLPDTVRRARLLSTLTTAGIEYEMIWGIDGRSGLPAKYEPMIDRATARQYLGRDMSDGEFACALSHLSIYQAFLKTGLPGAVVFEDDAVITPGFLKVYESLETPPCDLLFLDHRRTYVNPGNKMTLGSGFGAVEATIPPFLANGYVISREGAEYILANALPLSRPADWPCDLGPLTKYACTPRLVDHPDKASSNSSLEQGRRKPKRPRIHRFLRKEYWRNWRLKRSSTLIA